MGVPPTRIRLDPQGHEHARSLKPFDRGVAAGHRPVEQVPEPIEPRDPPRPDLPLDEIRRHRGLRSRPHRRQPARREIPQPLLAVAPDDRHLALGPQDVEKHRGVLSLVVPPAGLATPRRLDSRSLGCASARAAGARGARTARTPRSPRASRGRSGGASTRRGDIGASRSDVAGGRSIGTMCAQYSNIVRSVHIRRSSCDTRNRGPRRLYKTRCSVRASTDVGSIWTWPRAASTSSTERGRRASRRCPMTASWRARRRETPRALVAWRQSLAAPPDAPRRPSPRCRTGMAARPYLL